MTEVNTYKTALKKSNSFEILRQQWERYDGVRSINQTYRQRFADE
jgi:hypothetical protein